MDSPRRAKHLPAALTLGLALGLPGIVAAQVSGVSSGSGAGTGTGTSAGSGYNSTGTGAESGAGNSTGTGNESGNNSSNSVGNFGGPAGRTPNGSLVTMPSEGMRPIPGLEVSPREIAKIDARLLNQARSVTDPADRALVLQRIASTKIIFGERLGDAHVALVEAAEAARQLPPSSLRDRRLMSIVETLLSLAEAEVRLGMQPAGAGGGDDADAGDSPITPPADNSEGGGPRWLGRADDEWDRADRVASDITNPNFRGQQLSRVSESMALGTAQLSGESGMFQDAPSPSEKPREDRNLVERSDRVLARATGYGLRIDFPVWRDHALQIIAIKASHAGRFAQALSASRQIGRPEIRVDALVHVAEAQVWRNLQDEATRTYTETARAVASIPSDDPRMVLAGILIDSLVSMGRFDDARANIGFIAKAHRKLDALGAVAESQGRRGLADAAMTWIERDVPVADRPILRRRVTDGMLATVEQYRTNAQNIDRAR